MQTGLAHRRPSPQTDLGLVVVSARGGGRGAGRVEKAQRAEQRAGIWEWAEQGGRHRGPRRWSEGCREARREARWAQ